MVILTANDLSKSFGDRTLFDALSFGIDSQDKIGIIGANGAGKSTLLHIITGEVQADSGELAINREARIELLSQRPDLNLEANAMEAVLEDGPQAFQVLQDYEKACRQLEHSPMDEGALARVTRLSDLMDSVDGWSVEGQARALLQALGLEDAPQKVGEMSGGQRKRVALARALLRPCDLLILDEPTNHLDVRTIEWLESYLTSRQGALLLITHDRYFLDRVTNVIFELAERTIYRHQGNYSAFLESRAARQENQVAQEQRRKQLAKKELAWLRRGPPARTTKSKSRIERAHNLLDARYGPEARDDVSIETLSSRLGKKIMELDEVTKSYGALTVVRDVTYTFPRRDRVGIVGPNGAGKSTLLNLMTGKIKPDSGSIAVGETVVFGYYDQESMDLDESMRVHDYITSASNDIQTRDGSLSAAQMLERFLFSRQRQWDPIRKLSGGERRRLYLLRVLMEQPNVLVLDEPTNDLDVETLTVLEDYLESFDGVVIVVSHDRYFLDRTVEHLLVFQPDSTIVEFPGSYSTWLEVRREEEAQALAAQRAEQRGQESARAASAPAKKLSYMEQRELDELGPELEALEQEITALNAKMAAQHDDYTALQELAARKQAITQQLEDAMERWMELEEKRESL